MNLYADYILLNEIKQLSTTKKSLWSLENKKYTFLVSPTLPKNLIKMAFENYFNVRVCKVNTLNLPTKKKFVGKYTGFKAKQKKTVITLHKTDAISLFTDI